MAKKNAFLVSYILDNQPQSTTVEAEADSMTPEEALARLQTQHGGGTITDVQVTHIDPERTAFPPGHYHQP